MHQTGQGEEYIPKYTELWLRTQGGCDRSTEDAYSSITSDPIFAFAGRPCCHKLEFLYGYLKKIVVWFGICLFWVEWDAFLCLFWGGVGCLFMFVCLFLVGRNVGLRLHVTTDVALS